MSLEMWDLAIFVWQRNLTIFEVVLGNVAWSAAIKLALICLAAQTISVAIEHWLAKHHAFIMKTFLKQCSVIVTQHTFATILAFIEMTVFQAAIL